MNSNVYFYHKLLRKYELIIGNVFTGIMCSRTGTNIKVPVGFAEKHKFIQRFLRRDESLKGVAMTMPRIAIKFQDIIYDGERKLNRLNKIVIAETDSNREIVYTPVPYNIQVQVSALANRNNDIWEITEQILPVFTPDLKISAKNLIDESDLVFDLSLCLDNINISDNYEGDLMKRRLIVYDFLLTFKVWLFRDINTENFIDTIICRAYADTVDDNNYIDEFQITTSDL